MHMAIAGQHDPTMHTADADLSKMTAGQGEVPYGFETVSLRVAGSCPQEVPRARQLLRAAEWYVGIVMMIIGRLSDGEDERNDSPECHLSGRGRCTPECLGSA
jgi:hypothetical protein